jgi:hypothetical protein
MERIVRGEVPIQDEMPGNEIVPGGDLGHADFIYWKDKGEPMFSFRALNISWMNSETLQYNDKGLSSSPRPLNARSSPTSFIETIQVRLCRTGTVPFPLL